LHNFFRCMRENHFQNGYHSIRILVAALGISALYTCARSWNKTPACSHKVPTIAWRLISKFGQHSLLVLPQLQFSAHWSTSDAVRENGKRAASIKHYSAHGEFISSKIASLFALLYQFPICSCLHLIQARTSSFALNLLIYYWLLKWSIWKSAIFHVNMFL